MLKVIEHGVRQAVAHHRTVGCRKRISRLRIASRASQISCMNQRSQQAHYGTPAAANDNEHPDRLSGAVSDYWNHVRNYFSQEEEGKYNVQKIAYHEANVRDLITTTLRVKKAPTSDVMPDVVTRSLCECYLQLDKDGKDRFFDLLAHEFGVDEFELDTAINALSAARIKGPRTTSRAVERIRRASEPVYQTLFTQITQTMGGMRFLVGMRADLLKAIRARTSETSQAPLRAMDSILLRMLVDWFSVGFLDLQRISWHSPASYLEQVYKGEAVHAIKDVQDLKRRVDEDRRVYAFFHKSMPHTPLTVVHVALTEDISDNVQTLLHYSDKPFNSRAVTTAVFYSISSTQPGLTGADLGNFLIKRVVNELKSRPELSNLSTFVTLSPIPGFRSWLETKLNQDAIALDQPLLEGKEEDALRSIAKEQTGTPRTILKQLLANDKWLENDSEKNVLQTLLMRLCARYLVKERKRKLALDPVANFHVRNGASVYRINWLGDASPKGMQRAYGMMVNYRYILEDVERNNERYLLDAHIATGPQVAQLLSISKDASA